MVKRQTVLFNLFRQYWKTILWFVVIFILSTIKVSNVPHSPLFDIPHFDKIIHFSLYYILTSIWLVDHIKTQHNLSNFKFIIILLSITYGAIMELVQKVLIQNRSGDFFDALANTIGVTLAFILFNYVYLYRETLITIMTFNRNERNPY